MSATRNPRKDPAPGDFLARFGVPRIVESVERNARGTILFVHYTGDMPESPTKKSTISAWRSWAKHEGECRILMIGEQPCAPNASA